MASLVDMGTPGFDGNLAVSIAPSKITLDGFLLLLMGAVVGVVERKLFERRELAFDAV